MTRESLQRMLPAEPAKAPEPIKVDIRAFEYRFSRVYLDKLPPAQRPIEKETFGEPSRLKSKFVFCQDFVLIHCVSLVAVQARSRHKRWRVGKHLEPLVGRLARISS